MIAGLLFGYLYPALGAKMKSLGDGFIKLIKMMIAPIIFCTAVIGIAGMEDMKKVGKTGGLALLYFEVFSTFALMIGLVLVNLLQHGAGMNIDPATLDSKAVAACTSPSKMVGTTDFIMKVAPIAFGAMAFTIGKYGVGSLFSLAKLMGAFYLTCLIFIFFGAGHDCAHSRLKHLEVHQVHQGRVADRAGLIV